MQLQVARVVISFWRVVKSFLFQISYLMQEEEGEIVSKREREKGTGEWECGKEREGECALTVSMQLGMLSAPLTRGA